MRSEPIEFFSDALRLRGSFYWPDDGESASPLVVPCSGFTGLASIHPERFARYLTARGFPCFGFDYRGFVGSEGERGRVLLEEQVRDIIHAVWAAASDERVDSGRVVLLGWGMGAGLVIDAARTLDGVAGIVAANGFYDGERFSRAHRTDAEYDAFKDDVREERRVRVRTGKSRHGDPFDIYRLDPESREYVDRVLRKNPDYDATAYSWELADSLIGWKVEAYAPAMRTPLLVAHGDRNRLHLPGEATSLYAAYGGPKELFWLEGAGHTEFMLDDHPQFQALAGRIEAWIRETVK
jgi:hypothetical protein